MRERKQEKVKIRAIHDSDVTLFLEKVGLLDTIKKGQSKCAFCDCILNLDNFGGIYKENGEIKPFCRKAECYLEVLKLKDRVTR